MPTSSENISSLRTLEDIRRRKDELRRQLADSSQGMTKEVRTLFARESNVSPVRRFTGLMSTAGTSLDMALLGWRVYRKLNPSKKKKKKQQRRSWKLWKKK